MSVARKSLTESEKRAVVVARKLMCPETDVSVESYKDLGFLWGLIYWATFIVTFGQVKMTRYAFVLGDSMYLAATHSPGVELIMHECVHMRQRENHGKLLWYINYLFLLPTLFTMRACYEADAYTVSAIVDAVLKRTPFAARKKLDPFRESMYKSVQITTKTAIDYYVKSQFFGFGYFFMALRRKAVQKKMEKNARAAIDLLFNARHTLTQEEIRFVDATNIVDTLREFYKNED